MAKVRRAKTDPELKRQLRAARSSGRPVEAVLTLRRAPSGPEVGQTPASVADEVLRRVEGDVGSAVDEYNVLGNLGIVVVAGPEAVVSALLEQPEIESAAANEVAAD